MVNVHGVVVVGIGWGMIHCGIVVSEARGGIGSCASTSITSVVNGSRGQLLQARNV